MGTAYILEGPDGAGKTYFGELMQKILQIPMFHLTYYKEESKHEQQFTDIDNMIKEGKTMIVDRYIISDKIYGSVYRDGKTIGNFDELYSNMIANPDIVLVFVLPHNKEQYLAEFKRLCAERDEMYTENMDKVYDKYVELYEALKNDPNRKYALERYDRFEIFKQ